MEMIKSAIPLIPRSALIELERLATETVPIERAIQRIRLARTVAEEMTDTKNMIPMGLQEVPAPPDPAKVEAPPEIPSPKPKRKRQLKVAGFTIPRIGRAVSDVEKGLGRGLEQVGQKLPSAGTVRTIERTLPALERMEPALARLVGRVPRFRADPHLIGADVARQGVNVALPEDKKIPGIADVVQSGAKRVAKPKRRSEEQKTAAPISRLLKAIPKPGKLDPHLINADVARQGVNVALPEDKKIPGIPDVLSSKLSEYRARAQLQKFAGIASPKPYAIWLMQKQAFIGALLGGIARLGARYAPRLIARPMMSAAMRVAPRFATQRLMPQVLRGAAGRAVARYGGQMAPALARALPRGVTLGGQAGMLAPEALARASYLARGAGRAAAGAGQAASTAARVAPTVTHAPGAFRAGFVPGAPAAAKATTTAAGQAAAQVGQQAAQAGKASFMDIAKNYFKPETWASGWAAKGAKLNTALTLGMGLASGQSPLEAGFGAAAAIPFMRAGFLPGMAASIGAGMLGSKLFGNQQPAAAPPPPVAEAPAAPQMPEPMPMPMPGGYAPPPPPMFQPGFRG